MESNDSLLTGGDVQVIKVLVHSSQHTDAYDLAEIWTSLSIFEDLERDYILGELSVVDSGNILMDAPLIGNEKVTIEFKTPSHDTPYTFTGQLTGIQQQTKLRQGAQVYVMTFVSPEFIRSQKALVSKSYNKMFISDMVDNIYTNYMSDVGSKPIDIVSTKNISSRVVPTLSPLQAINWLAESAQSPSHPNGSSYIFFENHDGFYFGPLEGLLRGPVAVEYTNGVVVANAGSARDIRRGFYTIEDYSINTPDVLEMIQAGTFASRGLQHDLVTRTIQTTNFNYFDTYGTMSHSSPDKAAGAIHNDTRLGAHGASHDILIPQHYGAFDDGELSNISGNLEQIRKSQLAQFGAISVDITVPGDSNRTVGQIVNILMPAPGTMTLEDRSGEYDVYTSGRYLIGALRHVLSSEGNDGPSFKTYMSLKKDSFETPLPEQRVQHWS